MNKPTIDEILAAKPEVRPGIHTYAIADEAHAGLLKIGQTSRSVKGRVAEQLKTAAIKNYTIELDEPAEREDGSFFTDHQVRAALARKGLANHELEWMRCTVADVHTVLTELRTGKKLDGTRSQTHRMREEQAEAVRVTHDYFVSHWVTDYNTERPHSALDYQTPADYARTLTTAIVRPAARDDGSARRTIAQPALIGVNTNRTQVAAG